MGGAAAPPKAMLDPGLDEINLRQHQESNSCKDGHANGASDLFVLEQVNARGMGITTTIYKRNAAICSI